MAEKYLGSETTFNKTKKITLISLPPFNQFRVRKSNENVPRFHLVGTLHEELRVKIDLFLEKHSFLKNTYLLRNF